MKKNVKRIIKIGAVALGVPVLVGGTLLGISLLAHPTSPKDSVNLVRRFLSNHKPNKDSANTLFDIDDEELIEISMDDPDFRKEYGVSDSEYKRWNEETA